MRSILGVAAALAAVAIAPSAYGAELKIPFERFKLQNGLRVILSPDPSVPVVAVYVIYDVGARSEEKGRSGFAHLFEHMMFQGSKNAPKGVHFKTVEANGGDLNGSTHADFTDYFETMPSNKLPVALWLESDRMRALAITDENLKNQKEAVKEERRLSFDNRPYATAIVDKFPTVVYRNWQNSHSLIGSFEDLNAATVEDVSKFFRTYYAPNNAVLVIAGDVIVPEAKKWIESYFADIPSQPRPKHPEMTEPAQTEPRWERYADKMAQVPGVIAAWPSPKRRSDDYYAMAMMDAVLTAGSSSRFALNLVKGKESAIQYEANIGWPFAGPADYKEPGVYATFLLHKPDVPAKKMVEQVEEEIANIQKEGVAANELNRVKAYLRSYRIRELQSPLARARYLGQYEVFDGDPNFINTELDRMMKVTSDEVREVSRKYIMPSKRSVLEIAPEPQKKEPK